MRLRGCFVVGQTTPDPGRVAQGVPRDPGDSRVQRTSARAFAGGAPGCWAVDGRTWEAAAVASGVDSAVAVGRHGRAARRARARRAAPGGAVSYYFLTGTIVDELDFAMTVEEPRNLALTEIFFEYFLGRVIEVVPLAEALSVTVLTALPET